MDALKSDGRLQEIRPCRGPEEAAGYPARSDGNYVVFFPWYCCISRLGCGYVLVYCTVRMGRQYISLNPMQYFLLCN